MSAYDNPHQLLILGNGFDLYCGLKSRYSDFFSIRLKPVLNETLSNPASAPYSFYKSGLTVWDLIFSLLGPLKQPSPSVRWCDVEYVMKEVLSHSDAISSKNSAFITVADIYSALKHNKIQRNKHDSVDVSQFLAYKGFQCKSISDLYSVLLSELNMLETAFASYLKKAIKECDRYGIDSKLLLTSLVSSGVGNQITDATILNFNYTHPLLMKQDLDVAEVDYINIHGRCGGEIIFGIDGTGLIYDDRLMSFTKTYRVMASHRMDLRAPVSRPCESAPCDQGTTIIKFFGHSLAEADYSYFQSIFDNVNLYGGKTSLVFYYAPYCSSAEKDLQKSIVRLLSSYGSTMTNRGHGDNLIHKLLMEGRISIKKVPD